MHDLREIENILEAVLFTAGDSVPVDKLSEIINQDKKTTISILSNMEMKYKNSSRGIMLRRIGTGYQLCTKPEHYEYIERLVKPQSRQGLSQASLETLAIIAYKQPITKSQIDYIRGVKSDGCIARLTEKELIYEAGRLEGPGRAILYGTTDNFLKLFGLKSIKELPALRELNEEEGA